ncbi:MAG: small subunit ribosomal protein S9 [Chloroflexi bacterium]|jgi:small subunit ribosomal protein S9|nr:MAG: small subunit ribosomal protein S9 [Chloroflexota bacterium]|tara:strand:+ start:2820 stop:3215 length:396 start_codon:yes stop_codon:yes gene_type:complete
MEESKYYYGLGKRKTSVAKVRLYAGNGTVVINGDSPEKSIPRASLIQEMLAPLTVTNTINKFNIQIKVSGGGQSGWSGAISQGIAKALLVFDDTFRTQLRSSGLLTRDARVKERKKPGLKRARKAPQYTKR